MIAGSSEWLDGSLNAPSRGEFSPEGLLEIDAVPQHFVVFAADGHHLYPNQVVLGFFGWTLEDFLEG